MSSTIHPISFTHSRDTIIWRCSIRDIVSTTILPTYKRDQIAELWLYGILLCCSINKVSTLRMCGAPLCIVRSISTNIFCLRIRKWSRRLNLLTATCLALSSWLLSIREISPKNVSTGDRFSSEMFLEMTYTIWVPVRSTPMIPFGKTRSTSEPVSFRHHFVDWSWVISWVQTR